MIVVAAIEWKWGEAILDESGRDAVTLLGFALTLLGIAITLYQLQKTQSAAKAAELAAEKALQESRFAYAKFTSNRAQRYLQESKFHLDGEDWSKAEMRLSDLTHELNQLLPLDLKWQELIDELHTWTVLSNALATGKRKQFTKKERWLDLCRRLETQLSRITGPFTDWKGGSK